MAWNRTQTLHNLGLLLKLGVDYLLGPIADGSVPIAAWLHMARGKPATTNTTVHKPSYELPCLVALGADAQSTQGPFETKCIASGDRSACSRI